MGVSRLSRAALLAVLASVLLVACAAEHQEHDAPAWAPKDSVDTYFHNTISNEVTWEDPGVLAPYKEEETGRFYWVDPKTGETTWERPDDGTGWVVTWDEEHKRHFWHNPKTSESTWTPPEHLAWEHVVYKEEL